MATQPDRMVTLKQIDDALAEKNYAQADYLTAQWYKDRGIELKSSGQPYGIVNYIERLEEELDAYRKGVDEGQRRLRTK